jgi:hypothetical protein
MIFRLYYYEYFTAQIHGQGANVVIPFTQEIINNTTQVIYKIKGILL